MRYILLTRGLSTIVDDSDFELLSKFKWYAGYCGGKPYAIRSQWILGKNTSKRIFMHRLILHTPSGMVVDHINGDGLDNRRNNIRICTQAQNTRNRQGPQTNSTTGIRGVYWVPTRLRWQAGIRVNMKTINLGRFKNKNDAIQAYANANRKYFGEHGGK